MLKKVKGKLFMKTVPTPIPVRGLSPLAGYVMLTSRLRSLVTLTAFCLALLLAPAALAQSVPFVNPPNIVYGGGVVELTAAPSRITWAGQTVTTNVYSARYNGSTVPPSYTPPTIRTKPKEFRELKLKLVNRTGPFNLDCVMDHHFTNLHYHGFEVSPMAPSDDVVSIHVPVGQDYNYVVPFPEIPGKEHPEGMFWYHPHPHGCSFAQVNDGLSGALIVGDILKSRYPQLVGIREQVLLLKDGKPMRAAARKEEAAVLAFAAHPEAPPAAPPKITVNGLDKPRISFQPGELQFFRIGNVGANAYVNIATPGVESWVIAADGMPTQRPILVNSAKGWVLPPGSRVEIIVIAPNQPGTYELRSLPVSSSFGSEEILATLHVSKTVTKSLTSHNRARLAALRSAPSTPSNYYPLPTDFAQTETAPGCEIHAKSKKYPEYSFVFTSANGQFMMNDKVYDEKFIDVTCPIPSKPTWTVFNDTDQHHTFHIHQIHFRVDKIGDHVVTDDEAPLRDNVDVPPHTVVQLTLPFDESYLAGKFVLHCHILAHEDRGMMMNIELHR